MFGLPQGRWVRLCLLTLTAWSATGVLHAATATVTPEEEYKKLIRVNEEIQPLGENPFGENISLYDGSLSFAQTDVSLAGNGPLLQITRSFHIEGDADPTSFTNRTFADWAIELPRIVTTTATQQNVQGWMVEGSQPYALCTQFGPPPIVNGVPGDAYRTSWQTYEWWNGYQLVIPGVGSQDLLKRNAESTAQVPQMTGFVFPIVTKQNWVVGCPEQAGQAANDPSRQAFVAISPDGTKYWLNHISTIPASTIMRPLNSDQPPFLTAPDVGAPLPAPSLIANGDTLKRQYAAMLVTRIEDRFGNWLNYIYDSSGKLTSIEASDGRKASLLYTDTQVSSVTLQPAAARPRTWKYYYDPYNSGTGAPSTTVLNKVELPDSTYWTFNLGDFGHKPSLRITTAGTCDAPSNTISDLDWNGSLSHPSGLTGTFTIRAMKHGRSYVNRFCWGGSSLPTVDGYALVPNVWYGYTTRQKVFTGAGLDAQTQKWEYHYSPANESWAHNCPTSTSCPSEVWTDVVSPEGQLTRYTFSNRFDLSESQLLRTDTYSGGASTSLLRADSNVYVDPDHDPWVYYFGDDMQSARVNQLQLTVLAPLKQRTIEQGVDTYTWQANGFNAFAQVTQTKRFSNISGQGTIEEQTTYLNDLPHWVLGLPQQTKNLTVNEVVDAYLYDLTKVTLQERWRFGQKLMTYAFDLQGRLTSFADGKGFTTGLGNYKLGVPQAINYPDGKSEALIVDDFGQITRLTDQNSRATEYHYDDVGRVTRIDYPAGDEVAWAPKIFSYSPATANGAERGLPANHWKRTITTGDAMAVTYFDAMLRPVLSDSVTGAGVQVSSLNTYDSKGQKLFSSYPSANALTFPQAPTIAGTTTTYDALGRATRVEQSAAPGELISSSTTYGAGASRVVTDPNHNVTTTHYQVFDSPSYDAAIRVDAPGGITQVIARNIYGNPLSITQSGLYGTESSLLKKYFAYDSHYRLCRTTDPESGSEVMGYDDANNLAWSAAGVAVPDFENAANCGDGSVFADAKINRTYDNMNRVTYLISPVGTQSTSYEYDPVGRPTKIVSGISTWNGAYNFRGMLTGESLQVGTQNAWGIGYAHDANGNTSLVHYPDGENVNYAPDALGRPTQAGSYATSIHYYANGAVKGFLYGNGTGYAADLNERQLLRDFGYGPGDNSQLSESLTYDNNGNITDVADLVDRTRDKSFHYDALNRLTSATAAGLGITQSYTYDALNNLRTLQTGSQVSTYHYDTTNKLASISSGASTLASYQYDLRGNVTGKNTTRLEFDQKNQLTKILGATSYDYDASGRRVSKTAGGAPTYYFYSQGGQLLYQFAPGLAQGTNFIYLGTKLIARNVSTQLGAPVTIGFAPSPSNGSHTVSWTPVVAATNYLLQESANGGASWITVYSGVAPTAALNGREGGSYVYRVEGCIGGNCGAWTSSATLGVLPALPIVSVPSGTINGTYTVSWTAPIGTTSYTVQERRNGGTWTTIATNPAATSISRPGTTSGSYTYQVSANNAYGSRGWALSGAVTVDITYGVVPTAPASLTVPTSSSTGSASLSWGTAVLATRYVVEQSGNGGNSWVGIYNSNGISTAVSGLADGSYVFHVQACNTYGCSPWKAGSATLVVGHVPSAPASITVPATSTGSLTVSWPSATYATSYTLQQRLGGAAWSTVYAGSALSKALSVTASGSYSYQVQATNSHGSSSYVVSGAVTVTLPPTGTSTISVPASSNTGNYTVSWSAVAAATSYTLQEQVNGGGWVTVQSSAALSKALSGKGNGVYGYHVTGCNVGGCGPSSATGTITVALVPAVPGNLSLTLLEPAYKGRIQAAWSAVAGATSYQLQESIAGGAMNPAFTGTTTSTILTRGSAAQTYVYQARACNAVGCSSWGDAQSIDVGL